MTRNWIAASLILLVIAGLLGWQLRTSIDRFNRENDLTKIQPVEDLKQKITQDSGGLPAMTPPKHYSSAEFAIIPQQNLFSETRAKEEKVETPVAQEIPVLQVKPMLVGVTIMGNQRLAAIVDPAGAGTTRKSQTKRIGDSYQGYTVTDISQNQMVLEYGYRKEVIPLFDGSKHTGNPGGKTTILPTRIVNFGGGGAGAPGTIAAPAFAGGPNTRPVGTAPAAGALAGAARNNPQTGRPVPGAPTQANTATVPQPGAAPAGEKTNDQGQRVIRTPFGDIVRPN